jgi:homoserine kinase type II
VAVYTHIPAEEMAALISAFEVGLLVSAKGIAEGIENSNWLIETTEGRINQTDYEKRVKPADLPFFLGLLDHLAAAGCSVPRTIHDRNGSPFRMHGGKALALIEFIPGLSPDAPTPAQGRAVGEALARVHLATQDFAGRRDNTLGLAGWRSLAQACEGHWDAFEPGLGPLVREQLAQLEAAWPRDLPTGAIHADLFPDNVLMQGDRVRGLIDFYFACTDALAYDLAVTHAAWCFDKAGERFDPELSAALLEGYAAMRPLEDKERAALRLLARGAALRFTLTRAFDWVNTPADALVTRKDPMAFARRLAFYADPANAGVFA